MTKVAKLFTNGRSQAVRLPKEFRFDGSEVFIRKDPDTGDVILSRRPGSWDEFFELRAQAEEEARDFLLDREDAPSEERDPF
jgi:antitoxin VapB